MNRIWCWFIRMPPTVLYIPVRMYCSCSTEELNDEMAYVFVRVCMCVWVGRFVSACGQNVQLKIYCDIPGIVCRSFPS